MQVSDSLHNTQGDLWKVIWCWLGPQPVKLFLWLCLRERLLTNAERVRLHIFTDCLCGWWKNGNESVLHVLRDCTDAHEPWSGLIPRHLLADFGRGNLQQWLTDNLTTKHRFGHDNWGLLFRIVYWLCWKRRNSFIFE